MVSLCKLNYIKLIFFISDILNCSGLPLDEEILDFAVTYECDLFLE
jgi:hypothetical protein